MGIEIIRNIEREEVLDTSDPGANGVFSFRYQFPIDLEQVAIQRRLLGLDGAEPAPYTNKEKGVIATRLRIQGFLTNDEIQVLGGQVIERKNE